MSPDDIPLLFPAPFRMRKSVLREFHAELTRRVTRGRVFTCLIGNDAELRRLNRRFLGNNYATDVLSFPADGGNGSCGDLAISIDRAKAQAAEHGHSVEDELRILMLHGALHLAGFDHEADHGEMARVESQWRKRLGLPTALIERTNNRPAQRSRTKPGGTRPGRSEASIKARTKARTKE
jgi:probable rRNA maturation factor